MRTISFVVLWFYVSVEESDCCWSWFLRRAWSECHCEHGPQDEVFQIRRAFHDVVRRVAPVVEVERFFLFDRLHSVVRENQAKFIAHFVCRR